MDHAKESWMSKSRVVLTQAQGKKYQQPSEEMKVRNKHRRKLEELKDQQDFEKYIKEIWE